MKFAVIFDMDGVIVDNGDYHKKAWKEFSHKHELSFSEEKFKNVFFGRTNDQVLPELFDRDLSKEEIKKLANEKEEIYREIYRQHIKPAKGLVKLLNDLKASNIPVAMATSAPKENVDFILKKLDLEDYFDAIVDDSMVEHGKPHPAIYKKAAAMLHVSASQCVVFEDSLSGTRSAYEAGAKVVAITTTLNAGEHQYAHYTADDFSDFSVIFIRENLFN